MGYAICLQLRSAQGCSFHVAAVFIWTHKSSSCHLRSLITVFSFPCIREWFVWSSFCEDKPESAGKNQALGRGMPSEVAACHSWHEIFPHEAWELCMLVFRRWRSFQSSRTMETWFLDFFGFYRRSNNLDWYRILYTWLYQIIKRQTLLCESLLFMGLPWKRQVRSSKYPWNPNLQVHQSLVTSYWLLYHHRGSLYLYSRVPILGRSVE